MKIIIPIVLLTVSFSPMARPQSTKTTVAVPAWAKDAIWYQIFPERFRNGDVLNDPTADDTRGSWPHKETQGWRVSSWTGDWYRLQMWEANNSEGFYFHAQQRRYGGDLQGILEKLDYLQSLGVNALYLNPIFESPSLHKYDATTYHHIDNNFGPDPPGDRQMWSDEVPSNPRSWKWTAADKLFLKLIIEAHKLGMRIIIDGVFNHVGMTFWAFEDVVQNQRRSKFKDWFTIKSWDDPKTPANEFDYEGWEGIRELPELREDSTGLVSGPRAYVRAIVQRWMDPNGDGNPSDGVDGWRLDVANQVDLNFWKDFRGWVRGINPEAYITGEVWWEDWNNDKMFNAAPWLKGTAFDAVMNYRWARESVRFFVGENTKISAPQFAARLEDQLRDYPPETNYVLQNLFDSHDTDRLGSRIVNRDLSFDKHVGLADNPAYEVRKPNAGEMQSYRLMAFFQFCYLGAPMIYYGDECGMWGGDDPDCRKPMIWSDLSYENEASHPFGKPRESNLVAFDSSLFRYYQGLTAFRSSYPSLRRGEIRFIEVDKLKEVLAFERSLDSEKLLLLFNPMASAQNVMLPTGGIASVFSVSGNSYTVSPKENALTLAAKEGIAFRLN